MCHCELGKFLCTFTSSEICTAFGVLKDVNTSNQYKQGTNTRKVISEVYAFLYCSVLSTGEKVSTRRIPQPDMEYIQK